MKATELQKMSEKELNEKLADLKSELFNLRFQHAINQLENPNKIKDVKRDIARVKTVIRKLEIDAAK
ncbi:MAG: 50S ribosomal protein L29 [Ruminococcaceae bacterium]|nr:50S ribosomal protein L29 [Oscillospiraceae bacterium]